MLGVCISIVGLYLHAEKGFTGTQGQNAHGLIGKMKRTWPAVIWPAERGSVTAAAVLAMPEERTRDGGIDEWSRQAWLAFSVNRERCRHSSAITDCLEC